MRRPLLSFILLLAGTSVLFSQNIKTLQTGTRTSIRGLSVVDNSVAWVSGSNGWTALTTDGGVSWTWKQIIGFEKFDFRDIEAFSATKAVVVNAGSPAVILVTDDGGGTWKEVYRNDSPDIFLDGMDFRDSENGIIYGDPIKGKMQLLRTSDSGLSWQNISGNLKVSLISGEASFAASGTGIRTLRNGKTFVVTGGTQSRMFVSENFGDTWQIFSCPIIQGKSSTGPFSIAFRNSRKGVVVGGDYLSDKSSINNALLTKNGGRNWQEPQTSPFGYKSSVEFITSRIVIATGTSGTDISKNGGKDWTTISHESFNVVKKAKSGSLVLLAGTAGKISILQRP